MLPVECRSSDHCSQYRYAPECSDRLIRPWHDIWRNDGCQMGRHGYRLETQSPYGPIPVTSKRQNQQPDQAAGINPHDTKGR